MLKIDIINKNINSSEPYFYKLYKRTRFKPWKVKEHKSRVYIYNDLSVPYFSLKMYKYKFNTTYCDDTSHQTKTKLI